VTSTKPLAQSITAFNEGLVKLTPVDEALEPVKVPSELVVIVTVTDAILVLLLSCYTTNPLKRQ
jgi:hypothetical protein